VSRSSLSVSVLLALAIAVIAAVSSAAPGPGGWGELGTGPKPKTPAFNRSVYVLNADDPQGLLAGGIFTDAGGDANADYLARWDGEAWKALGASRMTGTVYALAAANGKVYAGGAFSNAGGNVDADYVAVWNGTTWAPACKGPTAGPALTGNVYALAVSGPTLYVGGSFQNAGGIAAADYLVACDTATGAARALVDSDADISGNVNALAVDSRGTLYVGGGFSNFDGIPAADYVASSDGRTWQALGSGPATSGGALTGFVRSIGTVGTTVYVATDSGDVAGISQADRVVTWNGTTWSALGSDTSGKNGYFPPGGTVESVTATASRVYAAGTFLNANGDPLADNVVSFDGTRWGPVGSNGAGGGPFNGAVHDLAVRGGTLYAGGGFTSAGGNTLAQFAAVYGQGAAPPGGGGGGGGGAPPTTTSTTPSGVAAPPATGTATGTVTVNGRPFPTGRVPYNQTVDVTRGRLVLRTDTGTLAVNGANGITAAFVLVRATERGRPIVELRLARGNFAVCPKRKTSSAFAVPPTVVRQLWGDGSGRFRTKGRYASASVRGTRWLTADRCDGTQARVTRGVIGVTDLPRNRQVTLRAGGSYLARP
jgi:hypothetical protein